MSNNIGTLFEIYLNSNKKIIADLMDFINRWSDDNKLNDPTSSEIIVMIKDIVIVLLTNKNLFKKIVTLSLEEKSNIITKTIRNVIAKQLFKSKCNEEIEKIVLDLYDLSAKEAINLALSLLEAISTNSFCDYIRFFF